MVGVPQSVVDHGQENRILGEALLAVGGDPPIQGVQGVLIPAGAVEHASDGVQDVMLDLRRSEPVHDTFGELDGQAKVVERPGCQGTCLGRFGDGVPAQLQVFIGHDPARRR